MRVRWGILALVGVVGMVMWAWWSRQWDGRTRMTIIEVENGVRIKSFDPKTSEGVKMVLPDRLEVETVGGRGRMMVGSLEKAAEKFGGMEWATDSVADYFGIAYTGEERSLKLGDRILRWWKSREVIWTSLDMVGRGWVREKQAVDGVMVLELAGSWVADRERWFLDSAVAQEKVSVTVVNATNVSGLGAHAALAMETAGLRVREVRSEPGDSAECRVQGTRGNRGSLAVAWVRRHYNCVWEEAKDLGEGELVVGLGRDYKKWWLGE